jgi:hypothetical protein
MLPVIPSELLIEGWELACCLAAWIAAAVSYLAMGR